MRESVAVRPGRRVESTSEARKSRFQLTSVARVEQYTGRGVATQRGQEGGGGAVAALAQPSWAAASQGGAHRPFRLDVVVRSVLTDPQQAWGSWAVGQSASGEVHCGL